MENYDRILDWLFDNPYDPAEEIIVNPVSALAKTASERLGREVTPQDILDAVDDVAKLAKETNTSPKEIVSAAIKEAKKSECRIKVFND